MDNKAILKTNREFVDELYKMVMDYQMADKENCCTFEYSAHVNILQISLSVSKKMYSTKLKISDDFDNRYLGLDLDHQINKDKQQRMINDLKVALEKSYKTREKSKEKLLTIEQKRKELKALESEV